MCLLLIATLLPAQSICQLDFHLTDGKHLKGDWLSSTADSFTIQTRHGPQTIPNDTIRTLNSRRRQVRRRVLGAIIGYAAGSAIAGEGVQGPLVFLVLGLGTVGFILGRELDRNTRVIEVRDPRDPSRPYLNTQPLVSPCHAP